MSLALWIPIAWVCIIGSRPVSFWMGAGGGLADASSDSEGTWLDKAVYFVLIVAGLLVLLRRGVDWRGIFIQNKWVCIFFVYLGISVLWSSDPFVSTKRWFKELGHVIMVLVVFSEEDPIEAARAFLARCTYLLIPLSVLAVKYYPGISRGYDTWTFQPSITGLCTDKNALGMTLFLCGVSLVWMLLGLSDPGARRRDPTALFRYLALIAMTGWLFLKAHSATATTCTMLGTGVLLGMKRPALRNQVRWLGTYIVIIAILAVVLQMTGLWDTLWDAAVKSLGRKPTLTGRSAIWQLVLKEDINPLIGAGFYSFWTPERMKELSQAGGFFYQLNEAHNGYIETYLDSGLIGVVLLVKMLVSAGKRIKTDALGGFGFGSLRLAFLVAIVLYNVTESAFDRLTPVRFALLFVMIEWAVPLARAPGRTGTEITRSQGERESSDVFKPPAQEVPLTGVSERAAICRTPGKSRNDPLWMLVRFKHVKAATGQYKNTAGLIQIRSGAYNGMLA